jgi:hypothetical protein
LGKKKDAVAHREKEISSSLSLFEQKGTILSISNSRQSYASILDPQRGYGVNGSKIRLFRF